MILQDKISQIKNETEVGANTAQRVGEALEQIVLNSRIVKNNELMIFKAGINEAESLESGDVVIGFVEGNFLNGGTYYEGDPLLIASYSEPVIVVVPK